MMAHCHCNECRKASGAAFATNASVKASDFEILTGEDLLREFESSPNNFRIFCGRCGSPIMKRMVAQPGMLRLRLGCLEGDPGVRPLAHVFVAEKPGWSEIDDDLPQFAGRPHSSD